TIDQDMSLVISSTQSGSNAKGRVQISNHKQSKVVANGDGVDLEVGLGPNSSTFLNYQWYRNNRPLLAEKGPLLRVEKSHSLHAGLYHVEVSAGLEKLSSAAATITISGSDQGCP